jgi:phosphoribosylcarboxyaminoimidazole (NCAIR) mutase
MVNKYLFLGQGSEKDPGFRDIMFEGKNVKKILEDVDITVVEDVVESCHGCFDRMRDYSAQMQRLADNGDRVVAILQGGLLFGLPSIQATQTTFPIISCPTDYVAYTSFMVPSGHACIASVGVERKGQTKERVKALTLAERILNLNNPEIGILDDFSNGKVAQELTKYGLSHSEKNHAGLNVCYDERAVEANPHGLLLRAESDLDVKDFEHLNRSEWRHHQDEYNTSPCASVYGIGNLAIFSAKVLSLQRPELREVIRKIGSDKLASYGPVRDLLKEVGREELRGRGY